MIQFFFCMFMALIGLLYVTIYLPIKLIFELFSSPVEEKPEKPKKARAT